MYNRSRSFPGEVLGLGLMLIFVPYCYPLLSHLLLGGVGSSPASTVAPRLAAGLWMVTVIGIVVLFCGVMSTVMWFVDALERRRGERNARYVEEARVAHEQAELQKVHQSVQARHDGVMDEYAAFLHDLDRQIDLPALSDLTVSETAEFVRALAAANDARPDDTKKLAGLDVEEYEDAVGQAWLAWRQAEGRAAQTCRTHPRNAEGARPARRIAACRDFLSRLVPRRTGTP